MRDENAGPIYWGVSPSYPAVPVSENPTSTPKKPWKEPHLTVYGNIQDLSESVGRKGGPDTGGMGMMVKTR